jgi:hypothetical protein
VGDYRLYFFGPEGRVRRRIDLACADDDEAIHSVAIAQQEGNRFAIELWEGARLVRSWNTPARD